MVPHYGIGMIYLKTDRWVESEIELRKAVAINPNFFASVFNLGMACYKQGKLAQAQGFWEQTLKLNPTYKDALEKLGFFHFGRQQWSQARHYFSRLQAIGAKINPQVLEKLGMP